MTLNQSLSRALVMLAVIATVQIILQLPVLPTPFAQTFNASGKAVGWGTPHEFVIINLFIVAIIVAVALVLPGFMGKRSKLRWRLPNRDYWLAPERLPSTIEHLKRQFLWHGVMTLLLLMAVFQLVVDANLKQPPHLDSTRLLILIGGYVLFIVLWAYTFWRKFSRIPPDRRENPFG
jgi:uncharacterized membrane protein